MNSETKAPDAVTEQASMEAELDYLWPGTANQPAPQSELEPFETPIFMDTDGLIKDGKGRMICEPNVEANYHLANKIVAALNAYDLHTAKRFATEYEQAARESAKIKCDHEWLKSYLIPRCEKCGLTEDGVRHFNQGIETGWQAAIAYTKQQNLREVEPNLKALPRWKPSREMEDGQSPPALSDEALKADIDACPHGSFNGGTLHICESGCGKPRLYIEGWQDARKVASAPVEDRLAVEALRHYADEMNWAPSHAVTDDMDDAQYSRLSQDFYVSDGHGYEVAQKALAALSPLPDTGDKLRAALRTCECGHNQLDHRDKGYDADVAGSVPGLGMCMERDCDCRQFATLDAPQGMEVEDAELVALRREYELSSLGDRPPSMSAAKLRRLGELEAETK